MSTDGSNTQQEIGEITPEQWADIDKIGLRWKSEQTRVVPFPAVVDSVNRLYKRANYEPPLVLYADGPVECVVSFAARTLDLDFPCRGSDPLDMPNPGLNNASVRLIDDIYKTLERRAAQVRPRYENLPEAEKDAAVLQIVSDIQSYDMDAHGWEPGATHYHKLPPLPADAKK